MAATAVMVEVMVDTAMVDTVARETLNHTVDTEDTDMVDTEDTDMVDTVESVKLKLPQLHTMVDMVVMVDTVMVDTEDTLTASKRSIIYIIPRLTATPFNLESFYKIHDNMSSCYKKQLVIMSNRQQNLKIEESFDLLAKKK